MYNYQTGAMYMDVINECEQLSDCILNVTEARLEAKESKKLMALILLSPLINFIH